MKRSFSLALILALLSISIFSPALAEDAEVISAAVDSPVAPAEDAGDTGLTVDGAQAVEAAPEIPDEAAAEPAQAAAPSPYARVQSGGATLFSGADGAQALAGLPSGCTVLTLASEGMAKVALFTQRGVIAGYMDPACLTVLSDAEHAAYMDAAAAGGSVALYNDDLNLPLAFVECAFADDVREAAADEAAAVESTPAEPEVQAAVDAPAEPEAQASGEASPQEPAQSDGANAAAMAPEAQAEGEAAAMSSDEAANPEADGEAGDEPMAVLASATGIRLSADTLAIGVDETYTQLTAIAIPEGSDLPAVAWRSSNTKYVKVDAATGRITGVKKGSACVYAKIEGGEEVSCLVTVKKAPSKIAVSPSKLTLGAGGMTAQLSWSLPKGGTTNTVSYSSSNKAVATVDANGLVTAVGAGTAEIKVKTHNGKSAKCKVTVTAAPASITFPSDPLVLAVDQKQSLNAKVLDAKGKSTAGAVSYAIDANSRDAGCVTLDPATGAITGVRKGQAIVTATAYNGVSASCTVTVIASPAAIQLSDDAITIGVKEVYSCLQVAITPPSGETECATGVTWSSSNRKIAKVDAATGKITGVKKGSCTVTATTVNGLKASCSVKVLKAPGKIKLTPSKGTLEIGQTGQYKVKFPSGTGGSVAFATSDTKIATIDDDGVVTALAVGTVTVAAKTYNGKIGKAKLTVTRQSVSLPVDDNYNVDSTTSEYNENMTNAQKLEYVIYVAQSQKGKPYKYGGGYTKNSNPSGFDCSGLVYWSFLHIGVKLEASAYRQGYDKTYAKITNAADLKRGDVVCFNTNSSDSDESDHTGIYLGNGKFIHSSSSAKKVIVSTLASGYYSRAFSWGRRILN